MQKSDRIKPMHVGRFIALAAVCGSAFAHQCVDMSAFQSPGVSITKAEAVAAAPPGATRISPMFPGTIPVAVPAYCRVDGVIDRRVGVAGRNYGIGFALALPDAWNGRFLFQGGGGLNGSVGAPLGYVAAGREPGLARGFAVVTTDSGHQGAVFDASFFADQQAALNFYYAAIGRVAVLAKQMIRWYYGRPAAHSYFAGCSTGGREAMIMSQRYPAYFDGIVSGDPAMRTGYSNLALAYMGSVFAKVAGSGGRLLSPSDEKLIVKSLLDACDAKDGLKDGMIFYQRDCHYDPAVLACGGAKKNDACLLPAQIDALKTAFAGPKDSRGVQVYPGFPYDADIGETMGLPGLLAGPHSPVPIPPAANFDLDREEARVDADANGRLGDSLWTNLSTFSGHGGKLLFYHGLSDPWFSPLDTLGYYEDLIRDDGGADKVESWSRIYLVPGMGHCGGGSATLDQFDLLTAVVDWVEKGEAPDRVIATGRDFPGRSRPLCAYPKHAQYSGQGDPNDAKNFVCRE
jgi:Tannase and feruloyl esterase